MTWKCFCVHPLSGGPSLHEALGEPELQLLELNQRD